MSADLTPEQEAVFWQLWDALQAAKARGDVLAEIDAHGALLDWQMAAGLLTREELRAMFAPYLLDVVGRLDKFPEGRVELSRIRFEAMDLLNGPDYAERAGAALFIVTMDGVQRPRYAREQAKADKGRKREWRDELMCIQDLAEDVAPLLWHRAYIVEEGAAPDPEASEFDEAVASVRCLHHSAGVLLRLMGYQAEPITAFMRAPGKEARQ